jgi:hypothetical protein
MSIPTEYAPVRRLLNTVHSFLGPLTFPPCARDDAHTRPRFFLVSQSLADTPITILHSYFCVRLCMIDVDTLAPRGRFRMYSANTNSTANRTVNGAQRTGLRPGTQRTTSQPAQRHPDMLSLSPQQILARNTRSQTRRDAEHMSRSEPNTEGAARTCSQPMFTAKH